MVNNKLIFYVGNFDRPEANAAGKRVYGNALIFSELGYKVILVGKSKKNDLYPLSYKDHILFYSFPEYGYRKIDAYIYYLDELIRSTGKPSMIVRYGSPGIALFDKKLFKYCRRNAIKIIADVVDWLPAGGTNIVYSIIKSIDTYLEKAILNAKGDGLISISSYLAHYYKNKTKNVIIIPPIVENYCINQSENKRVQIVYAGTPFRLGTKIKNVHLVKDRLDLAVKTFGKLSTHIHSQFEFHIFGLTLKDYLIAFPDHRYYAEEKAIIFHGMRPMEEVQNKLKRSDFSILLREKTKATMAGFPTKVVESMACGTPVITTDTSDLRTFIESGNNGFFVDIEDEENLEIQIGEIISKSHEEIRRIKTNCFNNQFFLPSVYKNNMKGFIENVMQ